MNSRCCRSRNCLPPSPTNALPGSPEKVRVLAERVRLGVALWHPLDARSPSATEEADTVSDSIPLRVGLAS